MWRCNNTALGGLGTSFVARTAIRTFVTHVCVNRDVGTLYAGAARAVTKDASVSSLRLHVVLRVDAAKKPPTASEMGCIAERPANIKLPNRKRYKHDDTNDIANLKNVKGGVI